MDASCLRQEELLGVPQYIYQAEHFFHLMQISRFLIVFTNLEICYIIFGVRSYLTTLSLDVSMYFGTFVGIQSVKKYKA